MTIQETIEDAGKLIPKRDAEVLLLHVVDRDRAWLLAHPEATLSPVHQQTLSSLVSQRAARWPLQYLTGRQEFYGLELELSRDVLIPRPETELLVEAVLNWAGRQTQEDLQLVDVGTGSGAIAVALASQLPEAQITALDLSRKVRPVVERNACLHHVTEQVHFLESDLLFVLSDGISAGRRFDAIVSNPPYVPSGDAPGMQPEVLNFEPHLALFAGADGLSIYRRLIPQAWEALRPGGLLAMEFGFGQRDALRELLAGWHAVDFRDDYAGIPRLVLAEHP